VIGDKDDVETKPYEIKKSNKFKATRKVIYFVKNIYIVSVLTFEYD